MRMSGARNPEMVRSISPRRSRRASRRSSKKSGTRRRRRAISKAARLAITPTSLPFLHDPDAFQSCAKARKLRSAWAFPDGFMTMLARRQELNTQFHQLIDALVLAFALIAAHALRFHSTDWFHLSYSIDPFRNYQWLLIVIMPFGPIFLDLQGFYRSP